MCGARLAPAALPKMELALSPQEYVDMFASREALPDGAALSGLCGRFIRGTRPKDFELLSEVGHRPSLMFPGHRGCVLARGGRHARPPTQPPPHLHAPSPELVTVAPAQHRHD